MILGRPLASEGEYQPLPPRSGAAYGDAWRDGVLGGDPPAFMADADAELSSDGRDHWPVVVAKSAALHEIAPLLSVENLARRAMPVLVVAGDDDEVRFEDLVEMCAASPDGEWRLSP